jgi:ATP-dependent helicase/nuclease subunit B
MNNITTIPFTEKFIERLADYIVKEFSFKGNDLRDLKVVFGGRRPAMFLKKALAKRIQGVFYPPVFVTIDDLMSEITLPLERKGIPDLDHSFIIFELAGRHTPEILKGKENFIQFLPWAKEVIHFIEQLDLEGSDADALKVLKAHAAIGFNVPPDINRLLESLMVLRREYHRYLDEHRLTSRGYRYLSASRLVTNYKPDSGQILFCNFFYLHRTEMAVIKHLVDNKSASLIVQGDERRWPALKRIGSAFNQSITEGPQVVETKFDLNVYAAFDMHAQAGLVSEILKKVKDQSQTVVVLPNPDFMLPLLSSIGPQLKQFNISLGYPLKRSSLYALLESIFQAHKTMKDGLYYSRDYLKTLRHPLVKNLQFGSDESSVVRILVHKLEEALTGALVTDVSGKLFISIDDILKDEVFFDAAAVSIQSMDIAVNTARLKDIIKELHNGLFDCFKDLSTFAELAKSIESFCQLLQASGSMGKYPLNERVSGRLQEIAGEWAQSRLNNHTFSTDELFRIVVENLSSQLVAFSGSPLQGLQILGLLETRSLSFDNVIVVDVNERILPNLNIYEPLIPREVMIKMNIDRLELEEEIQRYQFMRLISSAKQVHLIYQERPDRERSRFVEELVWEQEQKQNKMGVVDISRPAFKVAINETHRSIAKSKEIVEFLKSFTFSASSVNTYLRNPYEFYQSYVLGLREKEDLLDEPESRHVGTFVHGLLEDAFKPFIGKKPVIDAAFRRRFMEMFEEQFKQSFGRGMKSDAFLLKAVLENRLGRFLDVEAERTEAKVKEVLFIERKFEDIIQLSCGPVKFSYRVDRVDLLNDGTVMILDYKTGGSDAMPTAFEATPDICRQSLRDELKSFQMPLYLYYLDRQYPNTNVNAGLYQLRTMNIDAFITSKTKMARPDMVAHFLKALDFVMTEIFSQEIPFIDDPVEIE